MAIIERKEKFLIDPKYGCTLSYVESIFLADHTHDFYELFLVVEGEVVHVLNACQQHMRRGDLCLLRPGDSHHLLPAGTGSFRKMNFMASSAFINSLLELFSQCRPMLQALKEPPAKPVTLSHELVQAYHKRFLNIISLSPCRVEETELKSKLLLADIIGSMAELLEKQSFDCPPEWFEKMLIDMKDSQNYLQGVKQLEVLSGRSLEYISRLFKKHLGITPTEFLNEAKLQNARMLLTNTDMSVLDISLEAGFNTLSNFYKAFEDRFGLAPGAFRKNLLLNK